MNAQLSSPSSDEIRQAVHVLVSGGIVIFPTDTAFGIGCRIDDTSAVDRVFSIRNRPRTQATPVLVQSVDMALSYYRSPGTTVHRLMDSYWPGAVTIVAPCDPTTVYAPVRGNTDTIGLRMPAYDAVLRIIGSVGVPILGPSANFHSHPTPYAFDDLDPELVNLVDYVLPGICTGTAASTVVDCTKDPFSIIRQGAVTVI